MSAEAAQAQSRDTTYDARIIDDLRAFRISTKKHGRERAVITVDELDALLAAADERDEMKRAACAEKDDGLEEAVCAHCLGMIVSRPGLAWHHIRPSAEHAEYLTRPRGPADANDIDERFEIARSTCRKCSGVIYLSRRNGKWWHLGDAIVDHRADNGRAVSDSPQA